MNHDAQDNTKPERQRKRTVKTLVAVSVGFLGFLALLTYSARVVVRESFHEEYDLFRSVKVGMTEEEVVRLLGPPHRVYAATDAPGDYYVEGYNRKERPITNKVFIYVASEPIAYVYFDYENRVEDVYVGGS